MGGQGFENKRAAGKWEETTARFARLLTWIASIGSFVRVVALVSVEILPLALPSQELGSSGSPDL